MLQAPLRSWSRYLRSHSCTFHGRLPWQGTMPSRRPTLTTGETLWNMPIAVSWLVWSSTILATPAAAPGGGWSPRRLDQVIQDGVHVSRSVAAGLESVFRQSSIRAVKQLWTRADLEQAIAGPNDLERRERRSILSVRAASDWNQHRVAATPTAASSSATENIAFAN